MPAPAFGGSSHQLCVEIRSRGGGYSAKTIIQTARLWACSRYQPQRRGLVKAHLVLCVHIHCVQRGERHGAVPGEMAYACACRVNAPSCCQRATSVARDISLGQRSVPSAFISWAYPSPALLRAAPISAVCTHVCTPPISLCQSARVYCTCAPWGVSCAQQRPPSAASASRWCREKKRKHHMPCSRSPPHTAGADS